VLAKKVYTRVFKLETLRLLKSSGKAKVDLERELGLYPGQLRPGERACASAGGTGEQTLPGTGHQSAAEAQVRQLKREVEILRQERDILRHLYTWSTYTRGSHRNSCVWVSQVYKYPC